MKLAVPCLAVALVAGCLPPSSLSSDAPLVSGGIRYQETSARFQGSTTWWKTFPDPTLHREIDSALGGNLGQQQLATRIRQASASLRGERSALFPQIDLNARTATDLDSAGENQDTASFGGLLSWELDVFGRTRSGIRAQRSEVDATIQDWLGGRLLLSAAVAETRFLSLEQRARLAILRAQIETNETLLELVQLRVGQGVSSRVDLLQQERQLDATRALIPFAEAELAASEYALDVLTGRSPGSRPRDSRQTLPALPGRPGAGVPSDLLKNRPDPLAQWNRVLALDARAGQALADRLPRFTIGASIDAGAIRTSVPSSPPSSRKPPPPSPMAEHAAPKSPAPALPSKTPSSATRTPTSKPSATSKPPSSASANKPNASVSPNASSPPPARPSMKHASVTARALPTTFPSSTPSPPSRRSNSPP